MQIFFGGEGLFAEDRFPKSWTNFLHTTMEIKDGSLQKQQKHKTKLFVCKGGRDKSGGWPGATCRVAWLRGCEDVLL